MQENVKNGAPEGPMAEDVQKSSGFRKKVITENMAGVATYGGRRKKWLRQRQKTKLNLLKGK